MASRTADRVPDAGSLEGRAREIGRSLFESVGSGPSPWMRSWWDDHLMDLTLGDPMVKVQLFRFVDAMPALETSESIRRHHWQRSPWPRA